MAPARYGVFTYASAGRRDIHDMSGRSDSSTSRTIRRRSVLALFCALFVPLSLASETSSEGQFRGFGAGGYGVSGYGT